MRFLSLLFLIVVLGTSAQAQVVATTLTTGGVATCNPGTSASITPLANDLVLACVTTEIGAGTAATPTLTGNGLTWVQVNTAIAPGNLIRATLFRASGASPSAGTMTITTGANQSNCTWAVAKFTGQDTSGTNGSGAIVQSAVNPGTGSDTSLSVTLGAFGSANNATMGCFGISNNTTLTPGSGFTEVGAQATGFGSRTMNEFRNDNDTTVDATFSLSIPVGVAVEIKQAIVASGRRRGGQPQRFLKAFQRPLFFYTGGLDP